MRLTHILVAVNCELNRNFAYTSGISHKPSGNFEIYNYSRAEKVARWRNCWRCLCTSGYNLAGVSIVLAT